MEVDREQLEVLASERDDWEDIWIGSMPVGRVWRDIKYTYVHSV